MCMLIFIIKFDEPLDKMSTYYAFTVIMCSQYGIIFMQFFSDLQCFCDRVEAWPRPCEAMAAGHWT